MNEQMKTTKSEKSYTVIDVRVQPAAGRLRMYSPHDNWKLIGWPVKSSRYWQIPVYTLSRGAYGEKEKKG